MGSEAQFVSADASVIRGVVNNQNYTPCAVAWILQDDGTYKCDLFYQDYFSADGSDASKPYIYVRPMGLSANGKYASITLVTMTGQNIARYDIANRKLDVYEPDGSDGIEAGTVFESSAIPTTERWPASCSRVRECSSSRQLQCGITTAKVPTFCLTSIPN